MKLLKLSFGVPPRILEGALNKYSFSYLIYFLFLKEGPQNSICFRPHKTWIRPSSWILRRRSAQAYIICSCLKLSVIQQKFVLLIMSLRPALILVYILSPVLNTLIPVTLTSSVLMGTA